ncbi:hypothetical protein V1477_012101 [Vespula maculifrons]|uniref:Uncharacterized protein n=1 Tax=Vespula maculifrons TaxID=7453 RepID=A0ABD2BWM7_VESMC
MNHRTESQEISFNTRKTVNLFLETLRHRLGTKYRFLFLKNITYNVREEIEIKTGISKRKKQVKKKYSLKRNRLPRYSQSITTGEFYARYYIYVHVY